MVILTYISGFGSRGFQHKLRKKASPSFSNTYCTNDEMFAKRNQVARHKITIGCTGLILIGYPVYKNFNTYAKFLLSSPNLKRIFSTTSTYLHLIKNNASPHGQLMSSFLARLCPSSQQTSQDSQWSLQPCPE